MPTIYKKSAVWPAITAMATRRVDFVGIGDSTQIYGGTGHDHGFQYAASSVWPMYAHGMIFLGENKVYGYGTGYGIGYFGEGQPGIYPASANLTGTVSVTSGSDALSGSGTSFTTELQANQFIKLATGEIYRVISIANDTAATMNATASTSRAAQTFARYPIVPAGIPVGFTGLPQDTLSVWHHYTESGTSTSKHGVIVSSTSPIGVVNALQFDFRTMTFDSGAGVHIPRVRREDNFATLATGVVFNTNTGAVGLATLTSSIAADPARTCNIGAYFNRPGYTETGPCGGSWVRASNPAAAAGFSYHTGAYLGGKSARDFAIAYQATSDAALAETFAEYRRLQLINGETSAKVVFVIECGPNDRNDTNPSITQAIDSSTKDGLKDNIKTICARINSVWENFVQAPTSELYFLLFVHPVNAADTQQYIDFRAGLNEICDEQAQTAAIDFSDYTQHAGWFADATHLNQTGYEGVWTGGVAELADTPSTEYGSITFISELFGHEYA